MPRLVPDALLDTPDNGRIATIAALVALAGHAIVILSVLLLLPRCAQEAPAAPTVVGVTVISSRPGGAAPAPSASARQAAAPAASPRPSVLSDLASGERLDRLIAPKAAAAPTPARATSDLRSAASTASAASAAPGGAGSSQADQGLGPGEGVEGVDLYAAASLPNVGQRPTSPPTGDLWNRVAPCWRAAARRKAVLMVEIGGDGGLVASPQAVRKISAAVDAQTLLAERAAVRALQACAPYAGLAARRWRVTFP